MDNFKTEMFHTVALSALVLVVEFSIDRSIDCIHNVLSNFMWKVIHFRGQCGRF